MGCPSCDTRNPDAARFCIGCGAALPVTCAACGQTSPPAARFCMQCGGPLGPGAQAPAEAMATQPPRSYTPPHLADQILADRAAFQGERKQITVLFADVVGSTEIIRDRD